MIKVLVKKLKPSVKLPLYKTDGASGMDLMAYIDKSIELKPGESCLVPIVLYDGNFTEGSFFFTKTLIISLNDQ